MCEPVAVPDDELLEAVARVEGLAWGMLGNNQLRMGQISEGRASLENSFKGDPYSVWVKNTLDLLDTYNIDPACLYPTHVARTETLMERAVEITKRGFEDVIRILPRARSEREIETAFSSRARIEGNDTGYLTIAASGEHACTLEYQQTDNVNIGIFAYGCDQANCNDCP